MLIFTTCEQSQKVTSSILSYLSETGHGLTGDDLIAVEARDEAQRLVLVLPSL